MATGFLAAKGGTVDHKEIESRVAAHYGPSDLTNRLLDKLGLSDAAPGAVPVEALFPVDQLHHGGVRLTENMAAVARVQPGASVLDAGSGIGGSSRWLAHHFKCNVKAIDLSEEFVKSASDLDVLVGLGGRISNRVGSVTSLPYDDGVFDLVWSQNVTMNLPDKAAMFAEAFRVLRPGGVFVVTHLGESGTAPIDFPLPWAMTAETSFALSPDAFLRALVEAGFSDVADHSKDMPPLPPPSGPPPKDTPAMGSRMDERQRNTISAVADGRLVSMLVTAVRT